LLQPGTTNSREGDRRSAGRTDLATRAILSFSAFRKDHIHRISNQSEKRRREDYGAKEKLLELERQMNAIRSVFQLTLRSAPNGNSAVGRPVSDFDRIAASEHNKLSAK
jgi:hypothetical protein